MVLRMSFALPFSLKPVEFVLYNDKGEAVKYYKTLRLSGRLSFHRLKPCEHRLIIFTEAYDGELIELMNYKLIPYGEHS